MHSNYFCTYFDRNYLFRGVALYRSIARYTDKFTLWVLCFDPNTRKTMEALSLPGICLIDLEEFEKENHDLLGVKANRKPHEYMWTCTPPLLLYILRKHPEVETLAYLDADLFVYRDLRTVGQELRSGSILLVEHGYSRSLAHLASTMGLFNVGLVMFKNDERARSSLCWWRDRCLEWCFDVPEQGRFGDQKYLDDWPARFPGVQVLQTRGAGLAPWNLAGRVLSSRDGKIYVDSDELLFYHFHSLKVFSPWLYGLMHGSYSVTRAHIDLLYVPYIRELQSAMQLVRGVDPSFRFGYAGFAWRDLARSARSRKLLLVPAAGRIGDILIRLQLRSGVTK